MCGSSRRLAAGEHDRRVGELLSISTMLGKREQHMAQPRRARRGSEEEVKRTDRSRQDLGSKLADTQSEED